MSTTFARVHVYDSVKLPSATPHEITFRPDKPGPVTISSVPNRHPQAVQTDTGLLGILTLRRPGADTKPVILRQLRFPYNQPFPLATGFNATDADLAPSGNWTCEISNETLIGITFETDLAYVSKYPIQSATFDIPLLSLLITELATDAGFTLHLQSSPASNPDDQSAYLAWSDSLANALGGQHRSYFHFDDPMLLRDTLDIPDYLIPVTDSALPAEIYFHVALDAVLGIPTFNSATGAFDTQLTFGPTLLPCIGHDWLDVRVDELSALLSVHFDGIVQATVESKATARAEGHDVRDVSGEVASAFKGGLEGHFSVRQMKALLETLFVNLMRLDDTPPLPDQMAVFSADAHLDSCVVNGQQLIVRFYSIPKPIGNQ